VERREEFGAVAAQALAVAGPSILEVDMSLIGAHPPYFPYSAQAAALPQGSSK
jgi:hypothetical protein